MEEGNFTINHGLEISQPTKERGVCTSFSEWESLISDLNSIDNSQSIYVTIASVILGIGSSIIISDITLYYSNVPDIMWQEIILFIIGISITIIGVITLLFCKKLELNSKVSIKHITERMEKIENKYCKGNNEDFVQ